MGQREKSKCDTISIKASVHLSWNSVVCWGEGAGLVDHVDWLLWMRITQECDLGTVALWDWNSPSKGSLAERCLPSGLPETGEQVLLSLKGVRAAQCPLQISMLYATNWSCQFRKCLPFKFKKEVCKRKLSVV